MAGEQRGADYEAEVYGKVYRDAGGGQGDPVRDAQAKAQAEAVAGMYSKSRGEVLTQDQEFRPGLDPSDQDYLGVQHQNLYDMAHSGQAGAVDEKGRILATARDGLRSLSDDLRAALNTEQAIWQGEGAGKVHGFVHESANWVEGAANGADLASNRYSQQSAAVVRAQNAMPEPVPFDQAAEMQRAQQHFQSGSLGGNVQGMMVLEEMSAKQEASQAAHQEAARVMHDMDATLYDTGSTQPSFAAPPALGGQASTPGGGSVAALGGSAIPPGGSSGGMVGAGPGVGPGFSSGAGQLPANTGGPPGGPAMRPGGGGGGPVFAGGPIAGNPGGANADRNRNAVRGPGMKFNSPSAGARVSGGGAYTPPKGGAAGRLGGTPAGAVPPPKGGAAGEPGAGNRSGSAVPKEGGPLRGGAAAAAASAAGKTGTPGAGGMPPGGGRGKEEDKDRKRPDYLQGEDPDQVFDAKPAEGPDGMKPVPPVIGS